MRWWPFGRICIICSISRFKSQPDSAAHVWEVIGAAPAQGLHHAIWYALWAWVGSMVLECYFDGANKPTPEHDRVVLATACGKSEQWQGFASAWNDLLKHFPAPPLHTKEAASLRGDFSREHGWDHDSVDDFISEAVRIIEKHIAYQLPLSKKFTSGLFVATLTIPLDDWKRAREVVTLPNSINEILTSESMGFGFAWGREIRADSYHFHFDQGEDFRGHALDRISRKEIKEDVPIFEKVSVFPEADSNLTPPLQMADLFAWCIAHNDDKIKRSWHPVLNDLSWESKILTYDYLIKPSQKAMERTLNWNTPPRGMQPKKPKVAPSST
jgi:hypothetical protein